MSAINTTVTQILDQMSVIALDCSIWSGARRLKPEDLVLGKGGQLPSDEVISLGSKKLCKRDKCFDQRLLLHQVNLS